MTALASVLPRRPTPEHEAAEAHVRPVTSVALCRARVTQLTVSWRGTKGDADAAGRSTGSIERPMWACGNLPAAKQTRSLSRSSECSALPPIGCDTRVNLRIAPHAARTSAGSDLTVTIRRGHAE